MQKKPGARLRGAMTELEIEVQDGDITVTLPGTSYTVTYYKPKNLPSCSQSASLVKTIRALP
jgi:hypothetical protein